MPDEHGQWTVGALVQANYGSRELLRVDGVPVGEAIPVTGAPSGDSDLAQLDARVGAEHGFGSGLPLVLGEVEVQVPGLRVHRILRLGWSSCHRPRAEGGGSARSADPALLSGYMGNGEGFDDALTSYAVAYADQAEQDFEAFRAGARSGRVSLPPEI